MDMLFVVVFFNTIAKLARSTWVYLIPGRSRAKGQCTLVGILTDRK